MQNQGVAGQNPFLCSAVEFITDITGVIIAFCAKIEGVAGFGGLR